MAAQFAGCLSDPELSESERTSIATSAMFRHAQLTAKESWAGRLVRLGSTPDQSRYGYDTTNLAPGLNVELTFQ